MFGVQSSLTFLKDYLFVQGDQLKQPEMSRDKMQEVVRRATLTSARMAVIVKSLHEYTHEKVSDELESNNVKTIFDRGMTFCRERLVAFGIGLVVDILPPNIQEVVLDLV